MEDGNRFSGPFFTLQYPSEWEELVIEDMPAFFHPEGTGALQIAATSREGEPFIPEEEMKRYLFRQGLEYDPSQVVAYTGETGLDCMACEFVLKDRFWLVHYMGQGSRMIFVLYNDERRPDSETIEAISGIIRSIRFIKG